MNLEITPVQSRADLKRFIKLAWKLYRDDPYWVPPLIMEMKAILDRKKIFSLAGPANRQAESPPSSTTTTIASTTNRPAFLVFSSVSTIPTRPGRCLTPRPTGSRPKA